MSNRSVRLIIAALASTGYTGVVLLLPMGWKYRIPLFFLFVLATHLLIAIRWPFSIEATRASWWPERFQIGTNEIRMPSLRTVLLAIVVGYVALMVTLLIFPVGFIVIYNLAKRQSVVPAELTAILPVAAFIIIVALLRRSPAPLQDGDEEHGRFARIKRKIWQFLTMPRPW